MIPVPRAFKTFATVVFMVVAVVGLLNRMGVV